MHLSLHEKDAAIHNSMITFFMVAILKSVVVLDNVPCDVLYHFYFCMSSDKRGIVFQ